MKKIIVASLFALLCASVTQAKISYFNSDIKSFSNLEEKGAYFIRDKLEVAPELFEKMSIEEKKDILMVVENDLTEEIVIPEGISGVLFKKCDKILNISGFIPKEIKAENCPLLSITANLSGLTSLELKDCPSQQEIQGNLKGKVAILDCSKANLTGDLSGVTSLNLKNCPSQQEIQGNLKGKVAILDCSKANLTGNLSGVTFLNLKDCPSQQEIQGNLQGKVAILDCIKANLTGDLSRVTSFYLNNSLCQGAIKGNFKKNVSLVNCLEANLIGDLSGVTSLDLKDCPSQQEIQGNLTGNVSIVNCAKANLTGNLSDVTWLYLQNCPSQQEIRGNLKEVVQIHKCPKANLTGDLSGVTFLALRDCPSQEEIQGNLKGRIQIYECPKANLTGNLLDITLFSLFDSLEQEDIKGDLKGNVTVSRCPKANLTGKLSGVTSLDLTDCPSQQEIQGNLTGNVSVINCAKANLTGNLSGVTSLDLTDCPSQEEIQGNLKGRIQIYECPKANLTGNLLDITLFSLFNSLEQEEIKGDLKGNVTVSRCPKANLTGDLSGVTSLDLDNCFSQKGIKGDFNNIREGQLRLDFNTCPNLRNFGFKIGVFNTELENLRNFLNLRTLEALPNSLAYLKKLGGMSDPNIRNAISFGLWEECSLEKFLEIQNQLIENSDLFSAGNIDLLLKRTDGKKIYGIKEEIFAGPQISLNLKGTCSLEVFFNVFEKISEDPQRFSFVQFDPKLCLISEGQKIRYNLLSRLTGILVKNGYQIEQGEGALKISKGEFKKTLLLQEAFREGLQASKNNKNQLFEKLLSDSYSEGKISISLGSGENDFELDAPLQTALEKYLKSGEKNGILQLTGQITLDKFESIFCSDFKNCILDVRHLQFSDLTVNDTKKANNCLINILKQIKSFASSEENIRKNDFFVYEKISGSFVQSEKESLFNTIEIRVPQDKECNKKPDFYSHSLDPIYDYITDSGNFSNLKFPDAFLAVVCQGASEGERDAEFLKVLHKAGVEKAVEQK